MQALIDLIKQSPLYQELWQEAEAEGEAMGKAKGLAAQRAILLKLLSRHHPEFLSRAVPRIEACADPGLLEAWIFAASEPDGEVLARLIAPAPDAD